MKCYDYKTGQHNSAGNPIMGRMCFCGTTSCLQNQIQNFGEVNRQFVFSKNPDCDCEYELTLKEGLCRKCEDKFYEKVFKTDLL